MNFPGKKEKIETPKLSFLNDEASRTIISVSMYIAIRIKQFASLKYFAYCQNAQVL